MRVPTVARKAMLGLMLGMSMAGVSQAACRQADLAGAWYATGVSGNVVGSYFDIANRCKLRITSTGAIVASSSGCNFYDWTGAGVSNITGGKLTLSAACAISGHIRICEPNGCTYMMVPYAHMDRNKTTFPLQGYSSTDHGFRYVLNFVKR